MMPLATREGAGFVGAKHPAVDTWRKLRYFPLGKKGSFGLTD